MPTANEVVKRQNMNALLKNQNVNEKINDLMGKRAPQFCSTMIQISNLPQMKGCTPVSILGSAMTAAALDLPINQNLGFAYLVPYNNRKKVNNQWVSEKECQFQLGYKGFIQLAQRTGQYKAMNDCVIPHGCLKSFNELTGELVVDFESPDRDDLEKPDGYAFYFELLNGFKKTAFWSTPRVEKHAERYSQSYRSGKGPWADTFDSMALKTLIKLTLGKYGILSVEMNKALETDQSVIDPISEEAEIVDYIDNEKPAEGITEDVPEETAEEESFDRKKTLATLNVLLKHREDDFKATCSVLDIPFDMWTDAPDNLIADLVEQLNA